MGRGGVAGLMLLICHCAGCAGRLAVRERQYCSDWERACVAFGGAGVGDDRRDAYAVSSDDLAVLRRVAEHAAGAVVHVVTVCDFPRAAQDARLAMSGSYAQSGGTGVIIGEDGLILTNEHVVRGAHSVFVVLADGSRCRAYATARDERLDLAVLGVNRRGLPALRALADAERHAAVLAIGRPSPAMELLSCCGIVTSTRVSLEPYLDSGGRQAYARLIECTTALEPGCSGGPLIDSEGRLVGLSTAVCRSSEVQRAYALPFDSDVQQVVAVLAARVRAGGNYVANAGTLAAR